MRISWRPVPMGSILLSLFLVVFMLDRRALERRNVLNSASIILDFIFRWKQPNDSEAEFQNSRRQSRATQFAPDL